MTPDEIEAAKRAVVIDKYVDTDEDFEASKRAFAAAAPGLLAQWADFPHERVPRPIVVLDHPVHCGFLDLVPNLETGRGSVVSSVPVPDGLLEWVTRAGTPEPLHIVGVEPVDALFTTDRGQRALPAYTLRVAEYADAACVVLDPDLELWWPRARADFRRAGHALSARIDPDDITVHVNIPHGDATDFFGVELYESESAAVLWVRTRDGGGVVRAIRRNTAVRVRLPSPLGGRVLLDKSGVPIAVRR